MKQILHILAIQAILLFIVEGTMAQQIQISEETQINIYPNPVVNGQEVSLEVEMDENKLLHIYVYDFAGKMVMESIDRSLGFGEDIYTEEINIHKKGLYLIKIVLENKETNYKQSKVKKLYVI